MSRRCDGRVGIYLFLARRHHYLTVRRTYDMRNAHGGKPAGMWVGGTLIALLVFSVGFVTLARPVYAAQGSVTISVAVQGGTAHASDFKLTMKKKGSNSGTIGSGNSVTFSAGPGTYAITAAGPTRYSPVWGGDCNAKGEITITDGTTKKCTLTNVYGSKPSSSSDTTAPSNPRTVRSR